jgi:hypothetical protein
MNMQPTNLSAMQATPNMAPAYTYQDVLATSERINWRVEDIISEDRPLDFERNFMPETLARSEAMMFLSREEQMVANQIRGHNYLYMFGMVEEFILPFVLDHARPQLKDGDDYRVRALLQFATEEAKHIHLFKTFRQAFMDGFGTPCEVIGPPAEIARAVLAHHPLAVALAILHIEWMSQGHYVDSVKYDGTLDPQFKSLLKHHWMEEAQHARLDALMVDALADASAPDEIETAVNEYFEIVDMIDGGLRQQAEFDADAFVAATGRVFEGDERHRYVNTQHQAMRYTFLGSGMTHPQFMNSMARISPQGAAMAHSTAQVYS